VPSAPSIRLIANPTAGGGRAAHRLTAAQYAFARIGVRDTHLTREAGDEARLAREAVRDRIETLAVLGGDGTWSRVSRTLVQLGAETRLLPIAAGTGNDFAKNLGLPQHDLHALARLAVHGRTRRIDAGEVDGHPFINIAGFGFDVAVLQACAASRMFSGPTRYLAMAMRELFRYPGFSATLPPPLGANGALARYFLIVVANGRLFGGRFEIAPDATIDDGQLDLIAFAAAGPIRRLALFVAAARAAHRREPEVTSTRAPALTIEFPEPPHIEADGEIIAASRRDVTVRSLPGALQVVCADANRR
jgi:diacylglycerol kinase (ATP)